MGPCFFIGYRWLDSGGHIVARGWAPIVHKIRARRSTAADVDLITPWEPGSYRLHVSLCDDGGGWLADVDPRAGFDARVDVDEGPPLGETEHGAAVLHDGS